MQLIFAFTITEENGEATFAGNIGIQQAVQVLQQILMADIVQKAKEQTREEIMLELKAQKDKPEVRVEEEGRKNATG